MQQVCSCRAACDMFTAALDWVCALKNGHHVSECKDICAKTSPAEYAVVGWCADSKGRTRALFTASAGNTQSPLHVPGSLGLSNIIPLTFTDASDVVRGNTGCATRSTKPPFTYRSFCKLCALVDIPYVPMQHA